MSYIIKNNTQGAIVARLTDAGRKKLSEGKLNIGLFQLGDSEMCYDCYTQLPVQYAGLNVLQPYHNTRINRCTIQLQQGDFSIYQHKVPTIYLMVHMILFQLKQEVHTHYHLIGYFVAPL